MAPKSKGAPPNSTESAGLKKRTGKESKVADPDPLPTPRPVAPPRPVVKKTPRVVPGVSWQRLSSFIFPSTLEHPESLGRLELFALYGPVDEQGLLRGGPKGAHIHTDQELKQMIIWNCREALFKLFNRPRASVETLVESLMPFAMAEHYAESEVQELLSHIKVDESGCMSFAALQDVILSNQERRLRNILKGSYLDKSRKGNWIPYQSVQTHLLTRVAWKKKQETPEELLALQKRCQNYGTLVAGLDDQMHSDQIIANVRLVRPAGRVSDHWDRYCSLRRAGRATYVQARYTARPDYFGDQGLGDRNPGCSSLQSSLAI